MYIRLQKYDLYLITSWSS